MIQLLPRDICDSAFMIRALGDSWRQDYLFDSREERDWVMGWASESLSTELLTVPVRETVMQRRGGNANIVAQRIALGRPPFILSLSSPS